MTGPLMTPCATCATFLFPAQLHPCAKCRLPLCLVCAAGAGCQEGFDHAPPGWALKLSSGVWSASSSTWKGRRIHERAGPAFLRRVVLSPRPGEARVELYVKGRGVGALPPDLRNGQQLELLLNGQALLRGLVVGHKLEQHPLGVVLYVPAQALGWGIGTAGGGWSLASGETVAPAPAGGPA